MPPSTLLFVVPLVPIPRGKPEIFSYLPPKIGGEPMRGSVVSIPFGQRTIRGIVWGKNTTTVLEPPRFHYKAIHAILAPKFLRERELLFAEHLARTSQIALGTALEHFIPKTFENTETFRQKNKKTFSVPFKKKYRLTSEQKKTAQVLSDPKKTSLLLFSPKSETAPILFEYIRTTLKTGGQILVLIPDRAALFQKEMHFIAAFGKKSIAVFHAHLKESERVSLRTRIRTNSAQIILGTNASLFLPFHSLCLIIIDHADASSFETMGKPFTISVQKSAEKLAELHHAKLLQVSPTPSFASWFQASKTNTLVSCSKHPPQESKGDIRIVNLRIEQWKKKFSPITEELRHTIASTLDQKQSIILCVSRSGMSAFSVCVECKNVLRCPACHRALSYQKNGEYQCAGCGFAAGGTPSCHSCGAIIFKQLGIGTERVERDFRRKFPDTSCVRYDATTRKYAKTFLELEEFATGKRDVLITTERGLYGWDLPRLSLIAMIDADAFLNVSRWDADERALRIFFTLTDSISKTASQPGTLLLQTFHPENPIFDFLKRGDLVGFFKTIEEERRLFSYDPFGIMTRIICRLPNKIALQKEVSRVQNLIETAQKETTRKTYLILSEIIQKTKEKHFEQRLTIRERVSAPPAPPESSICENIFLSLPSCWTLERNAV